MRKHLIALAFIFGAAACTQASSETYRVPTQNPFYGSTDAIGYGVTNRVPYILTNGQASVLPGSPTFSVTFDKGLSKGFQMNGIDGTVGTDSTAGIVNLLSYSGGYIGCSNNIVDAGATIPAALAAGLDLMAGTNNDNDHGELYNGILGCSGRPFEVGTDVAFQVCMTWAPTDVSDFDLSTVGFRDPVAVAVTPGSYTAYAGIGIGSTAGEIHVQDITTGTTDTTNTMSDATSVEFCTKVSSAGVATYTIDGAAPTVTDTHTFTDGTMLIPFQSIRNVIATPDPTNITKLEVTYTQ